MIFQQTKNKTNHKKKKWKTMQQNKINIINVFAKYMIMSFSCFAYKVLFSIYIYTQKSVGSVPFLEFGSCCFRFGSRFGWFSQAWVVFSCVPSLSRYVLLSPLLPYFLSLFFYFSFLLSFPLCCFFRYCSTFLWSSFGSSWLSFAFVRLISLSSSSHSLLVLTSYLPPPPRCSFRIAFSLVFCDF